MSKEPNWFDLPDVTCKVISQKGNCDFHHKIGQTFEVKNGIPLNMCPSATYTLLPYLHGLTYGASYPWEPDRDIARIACPDGDNPIVFELRRLPKEPDKKS
jgi:uncharacterized repeat protein (TIGR04076 family)